MPGSVDQHENPDGITCDLIDEAVASVRRKLARAGHLSFMPEPRKLRQSCHGFAKQPVHAKRSVVITSFKIIPDRRPILFGFRRPQDLHALSLIPARRAANSASTASLGRPRPSSTDARAASTFWRRKASWSL